MSVDAIKKVLNLSLVIKKFEKRMVYSSEMTPRLTSLREAVSLTALASVTGRIHLYCISAGKLSANQHLVQISFGGNHLSDM